MPLERKAEVNAKLVNNLDIDGSKLTLLEVIDRYLNSLYNRKELAHATKVGYNVTINTDWVIWRLERLNRSIAKNGLPI